MPIRDKAKRDAYKKEWYQKNKERLAAKNKIYYEKNKEKLLVQMKERGQTPAGIKSGVISQWKISGLVYDDIDSLYCHYLNAINCDECGVEFGKYGDGSGTFKCMDHSHETGEFRNFLCCRCNIKRGEHKL